MPAPCAVDTAIWPPTSTSSRMGNGPGREPDAQRHAVDELRVDEIDRARLPDLVHRDDVRMIERRRRAGFLLEAESDWQAIGDRYLASTTRRGALRSCRRGVHHRQQALSFVQALWRHAATRGHSGSS